MAPSRSSHGLTRASLMMLTITLALLLTPTHAFTLYCTSDPCQPQTSSLLGFSASFVDGSSNPPTDNSQYFDSLIGNGYNLQSVPGQGLQVAPAAHASGTSSGTPWDNTCTGIMDYNGTIYSTSICPYVYYRSATTQTSQRAYGAIYQRVDLSGYTPGTNLTFEVHVSQVYESTSGINETHYVYVDFYRGPYIANDFTAHGYFDPRPDNNQTTFLYREVILAQPAPYYPSYANYYFNKPVQKNVSFIMVHLGVSSGPGTNLNPAHPESIFDVRLYARQLTVGPTLNVFYTGATPASSSATIYISSSACLSNNLTLSAFQVNTSSSVVGAPAWTWVNPVLTQVQSTSTQLWRVDFQFPANVSGTFAISVMAGSVSNLYSIGNAASNVLQLPVLTQIAHLSILSPQYPSFPAAQSSQTINYTFVFDTDVYGFDITRIGLCQKPYENDTCALSDYVYVTPGTNKWVFGNGNATGTFTNDPVNLKSKYYLNLTGLPDGAYTVRVKNTDVISSTGAFMANNVTSTVPIRVDTVAPSISFTPVAPAFAGEFGVFADADFQLLYTVSFSELVTGLTAQQLNVVGAGVIHNITAIVSAPNSADPMSTWCYSTSVPPHVCHSQYLVQVNHTGGSNVRSTIVLSYVGASLPIVDLAGNAVNSTGGAFPPVRNGSISFSNVATGVTIVAYPADLELNEFQVQGLNKTNSTTVRFNFTFDYPTLYFNALNLFNTGNLSITVNTTQTGNLTTLPAGVTWGATTQLDNYTYLSTLTLPANTLITTTFNITLLSASIADVAGDLNAQSNSYLLYADTAPPQCLGVTYPAGQDRFAGVGIHSIYTNRHSLTYTFMFNEQISSSSTPAFAATFNNTYTPAGNLGTFQPQVQGTNITATYIATPSDDNRLVAVRLTQATDLFGNTQTNFATCTPLQWQFDFDAPTMSLSADPSQFAPGVITPRYSVNDTRLTNITIRIQFNEYVNLTQPALKYQLESNDGSSRVIRNDLIQPPVPFNCSSVVSSFCTSYNVTVSGQDTMYSILSLDPVWVPYVTDLAGNGISQAFANLQYIYLTEQTPPTVTLSAPYVFDPLVNAYRTNQQVVEIDLTFSKHIAYYQGGFMHGNCSNSSFPSPGIPLTNAPLNFTGPNTNHQTQFKAVFNVSVADRMTCQFFIDPQPQVTDAVGNQLPNSSSVFIQTRFSSPNVVKLYSPRGWLTNDLNPITVCLQTDTAINVTNLFGAGGANPSTANLTLPPTVPSVYDSITGRNISTTNRVYNATTLTFCADLVPITNDTHIFVDIPVNSVFDLYTNPNLNTYHIEIDRFDLNPYTYDNIVKDGIITNAKLSNGSITNRNIASGSIDQRALANNSVGTPQLQLNSVQTFDIADGAVNSAEIAAGAVNSTHLANNSVQTNALNDSAVTLNKLAPNSVDTTKIVDGTITTADFANGSVTNAIIASGAINTSQILDGAVTSSKIAPGVVLNANLANNSVTTINIADRNVTTSKLAIGAVTGVELANGSVSRQHLTTGAVDSTVILDGTIQSQDLANNSVNTSHIIDQTILEQDLSNSSISTRTLQDGNVTNSKLAANAVTTDKIADGTIINQDLANSSITTMNIVPFTIQWANMANNSIDEWNLVNGSVTTRSIRDASVTNVKLADNSVNYRTIANNSIDSSKILPQSIQSFNLAPNVVATLNYQNGSILNQFIAFNAINNSQLQNGSIDWYNIMPEAVQTAQIAPSAVTGAKIAMGNISLNHLGSDVQALLTSQRALDGSYIGNYSLVGTKLANGTVNTVQLADHSITQSKIAQNAITYREIAPNTINSGNMDNSSILSRNIAPNQIEPYHIATDFFTNPYFQPLLPSLLSSLQGINSNNIQSQGIDASLSIKTGSIQNAQIGDGQVSLGKLTPTSFASILDMFNRLAVLEATMYALVSNIDSRCLYNVQFTNPSPTPGPTLNPKSAPQHTMSINMEQHTDPQQQSQSPSMIQSIMDSLPQEMQQEVKRRAMEQTHAFKTQALGLQAGGKYPNQITPGEKYCGDGAGVPAGNHTAPPDNSKVVISQAGQVYPYTVLGAVMMALFALFTL